LLLASAVNPVGVVVRPLIVKGLGIVLEQATVAAAPAPAAVAGQLQVRTLLRPEAVPQLAQLPHSDQGVGATSVHKKDQI
jgi:hypothetical protein